MKYLGIQKVRIMILILIRKLFCPSMRLTKFAKWGGYKEFDEELGYHFH